jgi:four helix bundle protein
MSAELKSRTQVFALDVVCFCAALPRTSESSHLRGQLQRSSTSVAANYRAACRGRSTADFIAKLGIVEEEADECVFWLEFIRDLAARRHFIFANGLSTELERLRDEATQLLAITVASRKTARSKL